MIASLHPKAALITLWPAFLLGVWAAGIGVPPLLPAQDKPVVQPPPTLGPGEKLALSDTLDAWLKTTPNA